MLPKQKPPVFLAGTKGISSPICHRTELAADFLEEPVPTTSPTKASFELSFLRSVNFSSGSLIFSDHLRNAWAWRGISGLDHASLAGDKSSVFVSPLTL